MDNYGSQDDKRKAENEMHHPWKNKKKKNKEYFNNKKEKSFKNIKNEKNKNE
jgi:hypothetical protein